LVRQLGDVYRLATRALPLLLLVTTFLFINTEVWQVAGALPAVLLWATVGFFIVLAVAFLAGQLPAELARIDAGTSPQAVVEACARTPLEPVYGPEPEAAYQASVAQEPTWLQHEGGLVEIGHPGGSFHFDNEAPRHRQWLEPFALSSRLVSNGEFAAFIADGGYKRPELWMSEGWAVVQARGWRGPRYWRDGDEFSLAGRQPRRPELPVRHLSWFEADAYARWAGARLPGEAEWELLAPQLDQAFGVLWQWSASPYRPYPGFAPAAGAVGEYNGKFMSSQMVLRGSCFLTPAGHERLTYRNFYPPASRWLAAGLRLARDGG
jgi:ergothioneine biosynthesis protein EgtB